MEFLQKSGYLCKSGSTEKPQSLSPLHAVITDLCGIIKKKSLFFFSRPIFIAKTVRARSAECESHTHTSTLKQTGNNRFVTACGQVTRLP